MTIFLSTWQLKMLFCLPIINNRIYICFERTDQRNVVPLRKALEEKSKMWHLGGIFNLSNVKSITGFRE